MRLRAVMVGLGVILCGVTPALARWHHGGRTSSMPIIAGQPNIRVTPYGNVVAKHRHVGKRLRNGVVPLRRSRYSTSGE